MSDKDTAIEVKNLSKDFILPHKDRKTLKSFFLNPFSRVTNEKQHALDNVSFEVKKGEFFGIVGRNGSGKSTLLKCIAGVYHPTKGHIKVNGSLVPFIELGVGFNPELTGRENVFLNGSLLGFSRQEMDDMYDEIVEFSELERFMDQKLKNYSSGMQVRLAFSIAIKAQGDILLLDEVLAVGDSNFQKKCYDYFERLKNMKKTVILVTHSMESVERYCNTALLLNEGKLLDINSPQKITEEYSYVNLRNIHLTNNKENSFQNEILEQAEVKAKIKKSLTNNRKFAPKDKLIKVDFIISAKKEVRNAILGIMIVNNGGTPIFATNTEVDEIELSNIKPNRPIIINLELDNIFTDGVYAINASLKNANRTTSYFNMREVTSFVVGGRKHKYAVASPNYKLSLDA